MDDGVELLPALEIGGLVVAESLRFRVEGDFRSQADCIMFTRDEVPFCAACMRALERVMVLYK